MRSLLKTFADGRVVCVRRLIPLWILLVLGGCETKEEAHLVLLTPGGATSAAVSAAVESFLEENPGIRVQVINTPGRDYYVKSLTMLAGRAHVDLLWMGRGFGMFASRGALRDLSPLLAADPAFDLSAYRKEVVDWYRQGDALFGIPYGVDVPAIAYNCDLFDAAGLPYPTSGWTLEDMISTARTLNHFFQKSDQPNAAGLGFTELDYRFYGLSFLDGDHRRFAMNNDTGRRWLQRNLELVYGDKVLRPISEKESMDRLTGFFRNQVAMIEFATWDLRELRERTPFRWDVVAFPKGDDGRRLGWASSAGFSMAANSRNPELAWKLMKKLIGPDFQKAMLTATIPAISGLREDFLQANPAPPENLSELLLMLNHMDPDARIAAFQEVDAEWMYWRDLALMRKITVERALSEAESNINRILELERASR